MFSTRGKGFLSPEKLLESVWICQQRPDPPMPRAVFQLTRALPCHHGKGEVELEGQCWKSVQNLIGPRTLYQNKRSGA